MKKLLDKYGDMQILNRLFEIYPDQGKSADGYLKAIQELRETLPTDAGDMIIHPSKFGTHGTSKSHPPARGVERWGLGFTKWSEWLGMKVQTKRDGLTALCYCLWEMTYHGYSNKSTQKFVKDLYKGIAKKANENK